MRRRVLGLLAKVEALADTQYQSVRNRRLAARTMIGDRPGQKGDATAIMNIAAAMRRRFKQRLETDQDRAFKLSSSQIERVVVRAPGRPGEIDMAVALKVGRHGHVQQPALARPEHARHTAHRIGDCALWRHDAQAPRLFSDQHAAIRQEGQAPGVFQPLDHDVECLRRGGRHREAHHHQAGQDRPHRITPELSRQLPDYRVAAKL